MIILFFYFVHILFKVYTYSLKNKYILSVWYLIRLQIGNINSRLHEHTLCHTKKSICLIMKFHNKQRSFIKKSLKFIASAFTNIKQAINVHLNLTFNYHFLIHIITFDGHTKMAYN